VVSSLAARHKIRISLRRSAYGGTTAILVLPFGVIVREEEAESLGGRSGGMQAPQPDLSGLAPEARSHGTYDRPPFGATGRHRLPAGATGRRVDTGEIPRSADEEWPPAPRNSPRSAWEYRQPDPQSLPPARALPPAPWDVVAASSWPQAFQRDSGGQEALPTVNQGSQDATPTVSAPVPQPETQAPLVSSGSHLGMPIRVPQASLAPQLRPGRDTGPQAAVRESPHVEQRAPEATRAMMMTMQQGWQRGRLDELDDLDDAPSQEN